MTNVINVTPEYEVTRTFLRNYKSTKKIVINRGGTRSSKTYSLCQIAANFLLYGEVTETLHLSKGTFRIVRKHRATIEKTIENDFITICESLEFGNGSFLDVINWNKAKKTYKFDGRVVVFSGADNEQKLRGMGQEILYCNEANELQHDKEFFHLLVRTRFKVFIDFNPSDEHVWINTELEKKRAVTDGDVEVIVSTYKDNTTLSRLQIKEIERLEREAPEYWQVYGLGQYGKTQGLVYDYKVANAMPQNYKWRVFGLDFGYSNSYTCLVEVRFFNNAYWVKEWIYARRLTGSDIAAEMSRLGVERTVKIIADNTPTLIEDIRRKGFNVIPAKKGQGSVNAMIDMVKRHTLYVTSDSPNIIKDLQRYRWKDGTNEPIKAFDHAPDAIGYAVVEAMTVNEQADAALSF